MVVDKEGLSLISENIASNIKGGDILFLRGPMGAGKTYFVKELLKHFGFNDVSSPTYTIMNIYSTKKYNFIHIDAYRLDNFEESISDYIDGDNILLIEWPDNICKYLPEPNFDIDISYSGDKREVKLNVFSNR